MPKKVQEFFSKKTFWCAGSTHNKEEIICINVHKKLKKKYNNFISIIIPRHINRKLELISLFEENGLSVHCHSSKKKISNKTDVYLVDTYGESSLFYKLCNVVFIGGSIVKHGGQNPLEASRLGCKIIHGPNVDNFKDIYKLLSKLKISKEINSTENLLKNIDTQIKLNKNSNLIIKKIERTGKKIMELTLKEFKEVLDK